MPTGRFDTAAPVEAERGPVRRSSGPSDARTAPEAHHDPRGWMPPGAAVRRHPRVQAEALLQASGGRPDRAGSALLALQRGYGNRHVQQVVRHAGERGADARLHDVVSAVGHGAVRSSASTWYVELGFHRRNPVAPTSVAASIWALTSAAPYGTPR